MKEIILSGSELQLAIEGRNTNLRIWSSKFDKVIYFRIDKYNAYSCPLSDESIDYLIKPNEAVNQLNSLFGFNGATHSDVDAIVEIVKNMKLRDVKVLPNFNIIN